MSPTHATPGVALALCLLVVSCTSAPRLVTQSDVAAHPILLRDVYVLDVEQGRVGELSDVLLEGEAISRVDTAGSLVVPAHSRVIEGRGGVLLPGLVDAHGHLHTSPAPVWQGGLPDVDRNLQTFLYAGVTTVFDPADGSGEAADRRDAIARGAMLGPRVYTAGHALTTPGGHPLARVRIALPWWLRWYVEPMIAREVASPAVAPAAVARLAAERVDFVKLMVDDIPTGAPVFEDATVTAIVEAARAVGLRCVAHIGNTQEALLTGRAGVAAWMHGVYTERIPDAAIPELAGFGIPMVPTLEVFDSYSRVLDATRVATPLEAQIAPAALLAAFNDPPQDDPLLEPFAAWLEVIQTHRQSALDNVRRLHAAGVTILAGSDPQAGVFAGPALHRELGLLVKAGLTPAQAIRAATLDPARFLTQHDDPEFGVVAVGKRADLLLVAGNPLEDLAHLAQIEQVIVGGVPLERQALAADAD